MEDYVTELRDSDVLFGRGSGPNDHEGNIRFRQLVAARKAEYLSTNHRLTKAKIAREIVDTVLAQNGRFLKKMEPDDLERAGLREGTDAWTGVDDDTIMEKAKQALRQNTSKKQAASAGAAGTTIATGEAHLSYQQPQQQPQVYQQHQPQPPQSHLYPQQLRQHHLTTTQQYVLDDLEPIPIAENTTSTTTTGAASRHMQRPSMIDMPPPSSIAVSGGAPAIRNNWPPQQGGAHPMYGSEAAAAVSTDSYTAASAGLGGNNNPMLYVPRGMMQQVSTPPLQVNNRRGGGGAGSGNPPAVGRLPTNELSLSQIPPSDAPVRNSLRSSGTYMGETAESMDIAQLMSSFQSARVSDEGDRGTSSEEGGRRNNKMMASTETMGTIEPIPYTGAGSVNDMSLGTMNSSTFSILKNDDSSPVGLSVTTNSAGTASSTTTGTPPFPSGGLSSMGKMPSGGSSVFDARGSLGSTGTNISKALASDSSLSFADLTSSMRSSISSGVVMNTPTGTSKRVSGGLEGVKEEDSFEPIPVLGGVGAGSSSSGVASSLGSSALSMLKDINMSTDDIVLNDPNGSYRQQQQQSPTRSERDSTK